jgi:type VI secretion system protein ImpM
VNAIDQVGLFGKIRAHGDFVRVNASDPASQSLVRWLEDGNETLHRSGAKLSPSPLGFLYRAAEDDRALIGALAPGEDKVGRAFPLAIFAAASAQKLARDYPLVPALYRLFVDAASALLLEAPALTTAQLVERLRRLPLPGPGDANAGEAWSREAGREPAVAVLQRLFGEPADGQRYYAFHTFQLACRNVHGKDPGRSNIALDCPCSAEGDVWAWLELSRRALAWPVPPPFFWRLGAAPALVISLGAPPPGLLALFAATARESAKIWPLKTRQRPAIEQAQKALPAAQLAAIDRQDLTVVQLLDSLSPT